jgi:hypothetical protein
MTRTPSTAWGAGFKPSLGTQAVVGPLSPRHVRPPDTSPLVCATSGRVPPRPPGARLGPGASAPAGAPPASALNMSDGLGIRDVHRSRPRRGPPPPRRQAPADASRARAQRPRLPRAPLSVQRCADPPQGPSGLLAPMWRGSPLAAGSHPADALAHCGGRGPKLWTAGGREAVGCPMPAARHVAFPATVARARRRGTRHCSPAREGAPRGRARAERFPVAARGRSQRAGTSTLPVSRMSRDEVPTYTGRGPVTRVQPDEDQYSIWRAGMCSRTVRLDPGATRTRP